MNAGIAQLVERNLAKVDVAGSSPVSRSTVNPARTFLGGNRFLISSLLMRLGESMAL
jgi:hypothetical protein